MEGISQNVRPAGCYHRMVQSSYCYFFSCVCIKARHYFPLSPTCLDGFLLLVLASKWRRLHGDASLGFFCLKFADDNQLDL